MHSLGMNVSFPSVVLVLTEMTERSRIASCSTCPSEPTRSPFEVIYLLGWLAAEAIRFPHRQRMKRQHREHSTGESRIGGREFIFDITAFFGTQVVPLVCIFSAWLDPAAYRFPPAAGWVGAVLLAASIGLLQYGTPSTPLSGSGVSPNPCSSITGSAGLPASSPSLCSTSLGCQARKRC